MKQLLLLLYFCLVNVQASTLQDPTRPNKLSFNIGSDSVVLLPSALKLTAIISSNQNKQAIINRKSVIEGQQVQGYKVILISRNHVILSSSEGNQKLFVNNYYVKKAANNDF